MRWNTKHLLSYFLFFNLTLCSFSYEIIIKYKSSTTDIKLRDVHLKENYSSVNSIRSMHYAPDSIKILDVNEEDKSTLMEMFRNDPNIEYVQENYRSKALIVPDDTNYSSNQSLFISYGAESAWIVTTGSSEVIVAILDTGIDTNHPEFFGRVLTQDWKNFIYPYGIPEDDHSHGTHVAGIIGANGNNSLGVTGMDWNCKLLPIKILDSSGSGSLSDLVDAIYYSVQKKAKVINLSIGFSGYIEGVLQDAIDEAYRQGVIIVVAAGNDDINISNTRLSPVCNDGNANKVIGVAALTVGDVRSSFSNYSSQYIDVSAYGGELPSNIYGVLSTVPTNDYGKKSGTSMAAPAVSGIIALLLSLSPNLSPAQILDYLRLTAKPIDASNSSFVGQLGAGLIQIDDLLQIYQSTQSSTKNNEEIIQFYNYPNPVDSSVGAENSTTFYAEFTKPVSNASIGIYSLTGRKVHEISIIQTASTQLYNPWDLKTNSLVVLPPGIYIAVIKVNISGKEIIKYQKVLIK